MVVGICQAKKIKSKSKNHMYKLPVTGYDALQDGNNVMETLRSLLEQATKLQTIIHTKHPFDENARIQLQKAYKNEITWSSNALEGNTLRLAETQSILE